MLTYSTVVTWDEEVGEYNSPLFPVRGSTIGVGTQRQVLHELLKHLKVEVINKHCQVLEQKTNRLCSYVDRSFFVYFIKEKAFVFNNIHVFEIANEKLFFTFRVWHFLSMQNEFPTLANSLTDSAFPDSSVGSRARLSLYPSFKSSGKFSAISANDLRAFCT